MTPGIDRANAALRHGARVHLGIGLTFVLLAGLAGYRLAQPQPVGLAFHVGIVGLATWAIYSGRARYLEASRLRFTDEGLEIRNTSGWSLVPWSTMRQIDLGRSGFRVHPGRQRAFSVKLGVARDLEAIAAVFRLNRPEAVHTLT